MTVTFMSYLRALAGVLLNGKLVRQLRPVHLRALARSGIGWSPLVDFHLLPMINQRQKIYSALFLRAAVGVGAVAT